MRTTKKAWQNVLYVCILMAAIFLLFQWYSAANSKRIEKQNMNYAMDASEQVAHRIGSEFDNALLRIRNYSYLLGAGTERVEVTAEILSGMEKNAVFDAICFTDTDGITMASDGKISDSSNMNYYSDGILGKSGVDVVESELYGQTMMVFYAPVEYEGETLGLLLGLYFAEDYLGNMLSATYFGEEADVYLCTGEGSIIADSKGGSYDMLLPDLLRSDGSIDTKTAAVVKAAFESGTESAGFMCADDSLSDNLCLQRITDRKYILAQAFPKSVTQKMIREANHIGMVLQVILIFLFAAYILILLIRAKAQRGMLQKQNKQLGYVLDGLNTLFSSRYLTVDLKTGRYSYMAGIRPLSSSLETEGSYEDIILAHSDDVIGNEEKEKFRKTFESDSIAEILSEQDVFTYECHVCRNGKEDWEHWIAVCLQRENNRAVRILYVSQNITEMKQREMHNRKVISIMNRKERQYRIAVASTAFCTFEFNLTKDIIEHDFTYILDGQQRSVSEKLGLHIPCSASECFNKQKPFIMEESVEEYCEKVNPKYLMNCFERGEYEVNTDYWGNFGSGKPMCVHQSFIMMRDEDSGDIMVMVLCKNITAQVLKQREQTRALQEALAQAQHANKAKTTFLSNMSHDIRTPMNAVIGFTTIAISHIDNKEQVKDCLQKVLSSSNHLLSLINDILDMSRIESGKIQIKEQECNISELTHNLVNIIQPQVRAKRMELFIDTFDVKNEDIIADSLKLSQIFLNLLSNAVKYTPAGGTVSFRISQKTTFHRGYGDFVFVVKDNGIGMSSEFVDHIFEPFERESSVTKSGIQGTGLGMSITKSIVEMMGGKITVRSEKGVGSEFRVELSLKLQNDDKAPVRINELEGLRALVVDDDCDGCESVSNMLKQIGMRAEWTISGREAVFRAKSAHNEGDSYHTYIIDWQMPEMSGIETCRAIRASIGDEAPIIILTAYDWTDIEEEAKQAGVTAFCAKPLFMSDLKAALMSANGLLDNNREQSGAALGDFAGKRILVVDDNELNREIAEEILKESGLEVETAPDGTDAVDMIASSDEYYYDAVLMDVQMPVMDGYEATRIIRTMPRGDVKTLPIIAMTANAMEEDKEAALKSGMNAHIAKPIEIDVFMKILRKYLNENKEGRAE